MSQKYKTKVTSMKQIKLNVVNMRVKKLELGTQIELNEHFVKK